MKRLLAFVAVLSVMIGGTIHLSLLDHFMYTQMAMAAIMNHPNFNSPFLRPESMARGPVVESKPSQRKPLNILVIYPDDWRHDSIGGVGPVVQTPFLNTLARKGIRFTHNCVTTSICWISRASYFTGQYASRHKSMRLREPQFYKTWNTSWPGLLMQAGYFTGHVGKWQFANPDRFIETHHFFNWTNLYEGYHWITGDKDYGRKPVHASDHSKDKAIQFLRLRPRDRPFSLTVAFYPPKAIGNSFVPGAQWSPKNGSMALYLNDTIPNPPDTWDRLPWFFPKYERAARSRWEERFQGSEKYQLSMKNYYRLITEVDEATKKIISELKRQNILNDTLIIFTTDNGYFHGEHGLGEFPCWVFYYAVECKVYHAKLRLMLSVSAGKWYPFQESIRVPLIIRDPRMPKEKYATLDDSFTLNIDLAPTILGAAAVYVPPDMQGRDISDLYLLPSRSGNDLPWRDEFFYEYKLDNGKSMPMATALVRKDFKYIYWPQFRYEQLFHLAEDPLEETDVFNDTKYRGVLQGMRKRHRTLAVEVR